MEFEGVTARPVSREGGARSTWTLPAAATFGNWRTFAPPRGVRQLSRDTHFYNVRMTRVIPALLLAALVTSPGYAQTPQPFPRPGAAQSPARPPAQAPAPPAAARATAPPPSAQAPADPNVPSAATLGIAVYPTAQFLGSYDAGRGQRYYVFGTTAAYLDVIGYYRTQTDENGDTVFRDPPTHMFTGGTLGRFREETMAFPPSVTVKDWTAGGSQGYPNPKLGAQPARFATVIMIVPAPPAAAASPR